MPPNMERSPKTALDAANLFQTSELLIRSCTDICRRMVTRVLKKSSPNSPPNVLPSRTLHEAQRTIHAICGTVVELISKPPLRFIEIACLYWEF